MEYFNPDRKSVKNINDWKDIFVKNESKKTHWEPGRSACELANFMLHKDGENIIKQFLDEMLDEEIKSFSKGFIEYKVKFDKYKGRCREHDLGIWGKTNSEKIIFVGVESKVDEPFGCTIKKTYIKNRVKELNGEKTNAIKRIDKLLKRNFKKVTKDLFDIRYQFLYSTVGTIDAEDNGKKADIPIFLIIVFKTKSYDDKKGRENYKDFQSFIKEIGASPIFKNENDREMYKADIDGKKLLIGHLTIVTD